MTEYVTTALRETLNSPRVYVYEGPRMQCGHFLNTPSMAAERHLRYCV